MSFLTALKGAGSLLGGSAGNAALSGAGSAIEDARKELANIFPQQSGVGRALRAFNSTGNPLTGAIKMIGSIFSGREYRSDQYRLGEKYMLYVLGQNIHSWKKVDDGMVPEATAFFSALLDVSVDSWNYILEIRENVDLYIKNRKPADNREKLLKAQELLKALPFNDIAGAWINPLKEMFATSAPAGTMLADVQNVSAGMGLPRNFLLYAAGAVLVFLFILRRK